jgi:rubrerythrin
MRQGHPELNFRLGRGRIRERRKAFSHDSLAATCDFLGIKGVEKESFLAETDAIRATERWTCLDCGQPLPSPTSDPFRCPQCRAKAKP